MICPNCKHTMIVVEYQKIELDYCANCAGAWFDANELELMLARLGIADSEMSETSILNRQEASAAENKRRCPVCSQWMKKANLGQAPKVMIDLCPRGDGLYFDGGELGQVVKQCADKACVGAEAEKNILNFLGDTFRAGGKTG